MSLDAVELVPKKGVGHLVVTWVLMIPLVFFASQGSFWFQSGARNNSLSYNYGSLGSASMTGENTLVALLVFLILFTVIIPRARSIIACCTKHKIVIAISIFALVSTIWSQFPIYTLGYSLCLIGNTMFAVYLYRCIAPDRLLRILLILGWLCLLSSITLSLFFPQYGVDQTIGSSFAWRGIYSHKNGCAFMTVILLTPVFYIPVKSIGDRLWRIAYIGLSSFLIIMSQARTGWILFACLVFYVFSIKAVRQLTQTDRKVMLMLGLVLGLPLLVTAIGFTSELAYVLGKDPTLTGRTDIWKTALISIMKRPALGYGYKAFWRGMQGESANAVLLTGWVDASTHNGFLDIWLTLGAGGLFLVVQSFSNTFRNALLCLGSAQGLEDQWRTCILVLSVVLNIDEAQIAQPNNLVWILYIVASIGLAEEARRLRLRMADV